MFPPRALMGVGFILVGFAAGAIFGPRAGAQRTAEDVPRPRAVTARGSLTPHERSLTELFEEVSPSVVYVTSLAERRHMFRFNVFEIPQGAGSGFIWDRAGHIVTNFHVIQGGTRFEVTLADQTTLEATPVGGAPEKDLAVLRIETRADTLRPIELGTSDDLKVGQSVLAIGNPFGFDRTLTTGIISALGREIESLSRVPISDVIQTDAAINPGNSGGPLLDSAGRLIGVNTAIVSPSGGYAGIGFAIPVDTVNWVVPDLIAYGRIRRPTIGVELAPANVNRQVGGVLVLNVVERSGADRAGLRPTTRDRRGRVVLGDVIRAIDGQPVRSTEELRLRLEQRRPGEVVRVTVDRDGDEVDLEVKLGKPSQ
jgi:S1-C subfamily serine protease